MASPAPLTMQPTSPSSLTKLSPAAAASRSAGDSSSGSRSSRRAVWKGRALSSISTLTSAATSRPSDVRTRGLISRSEAFNAPNARTRAAKSSAAGVKAGPVSPSAEAARSAWAGRTPAEGRTVCSRTSPGSPAARASISTPPRGATMKSQRRPAPVDRQPDVELSRDVEGLFDEDGADEAAFRTGLTGDEGLAEETRSGGLRLGRRRRPKDASRLAPSAGVDLGLDDDRLRRCAPRRPAPAPASRRAGRSA